VGKDLNDEEERVVVECPLKARVASRGYVTLRNPRKNKPRRYNVKVEKRRESNRTN